MEKCTRVGHTKCIDGINDWRLPREGKSWTAGGRVWGEIYDNHTRIQGLTFGDMNHPGLNDGIDSGDAG